MVGVSRIGRKDVRLTYEELLFIGSERVPFLKLCPAEFGLAIRPWRELGIRRDDAGFWLAKIVSRSFSQP
jgi:hypothetical protein